MNTNQIKDQILKLIDKLPKRLLNKLKKTRSYLVGGAIRDIQNNRKEITDFDFVVFECTQIKEFCIEIADEFGSSFVELDPENQSYRIVNNSWQLDIVGPRGPNIEADLQERDLTINAVAFDLQSQEIIDPLGGINDFQNKTIKGIKKQNFTDDPLRTLRAFRVASQLSTFNNKFTINEQTLDWIKASIKFLGKVSVERIAHEVWHLMYSPASYDYLWACVEIGLWEEVFPEFKELRKVPSNTHHHLPLLEHTFELVKQYEQNVEPKLPKSCKDFIKQEKISSINCESIVKMGCLLHDISKPETWQIDGEKHSFHKHEKVGAEVTKEIGKRLKWSNNLNTMVRKLVYFHLRPFQLSQKGQEPTEKALRKFFRQTEDIFYPLIALAWADLLSTRGPKITEEGIQTNEIMLLGLCKKYESFLEQEKREPLLLKGDELEEAIKIAKLPQTKVIKELLSELRDLQLNGEITNKQQALDWFVEQGKSIQN